ncbi:hypothetical protein LTS18_006147 [Coniosporium uncinatum]|uniref:Uncharacterized protein n=1 Tax=Coniosporium uncinatum TaxID=93489 RepID=A0ACC3DAT1_9PEZI|nr:hypothetical protein LTS18_006147 [Coniosporium uncinatum]
MDTIHSTVGTTKTTTVQASPSGTMTVNQQVTPAVVTRTVTGTVSASTVVDGPCSNVPAASSTAYSTATVTSNMPDSYTTTTYSFTYVTARQSGMTTSYGRK